MNTPIRNAIARYEFLWRVGAPDEDKEAQLEVIRTSSVMDPWRIAFEATKEWNDVQAVRAEAFMRTATKLLSDGDKAAFEKHLASREVERQERLQQMPALKDVTPYERVDFCNIPAWLEADYDFHRLSWPGGAEVRVNREAA